MTCSRIALYSYSLRSPMQPAKEPLLSNVAPTTVSLSGRFLSEPFYREKLSGFRKYDPGLWRSTINLHFTSFMSVPFFVLTGWTAFLWVLTAEVAALKPYVMLTPTVHTLLGAALSFLMVFRTNTAYSRWWEARLLWGAVNNNTRSVLCRAPSMLKNEAAYIQLTTELMAFAVALKNHLRSEKTRPEELGAMLPYALMATLGESINPPLAAVQALGHTIRSGIKTEANQAGDAIMANASFLSLSTALDALVNSVGACERVRNTPTPFGYVCALRSFLLLWLFTMPFTLVGVYGVVSIPAMALVGFLFLNLEMMATEIEQPFGDDADDLPLEEYCLGIERVCLDFLKRKPFR